jgi:ATP adenylyltransferase
MNKKDIIWAPWRIKYIHLLKNKGCIFCNNPKKNKDRKNYIFWRKKYAFAMLNLFPYNNGHILIAPYRHVATFNDLKKEEIEDIFYLLKKAERKLKEELKPDGFNMGVNIGKVSGAGFEEHIHFHIVPRWQGDTNFMPVISQSKVISQSLNEVYDLLAK